MAKDFKESMVRYLKSIGIDYDVSEIDVELTDLVDLNPWISVDDRLPNDNVVVALHGGDIDSLGLKTTAGYWDSRYGCFAAILEDGDVELCTADVWMPLPEPPK